MRKIRLKKAFVFAIVFFTFIGCHPNEKSLIVGTWKISGNTLGGQELVCGSVDGNKITFTDDGVIKEKL